MENQIRITFSNGQSDLVVFTGTGDVVAYLNKARAFETIGTNNTVKVEVASTMPTNHVKGIKDLCKAYGITNIVKTDSLTWEAGVFGNTGTRLNTLQALLEKGGKEEDLVEWTKIIDGMHKLATRAGELAPKTRPSIAFPMK